MLLQLLITPRTLTAIDEYVITNAPSRATRTAATSSTDGATSACGSRKRKRTVACDYVPTMNPRPI